MSKPKKRKTASKRHDTEAIKRRVDQVLEILIDGAKRHDVLQFAAKKQADGAPPWTMGKSRKPLCDRTIDTYIAQANERIAVISLQHAEHRLSLAILRRERLYAREIEDKNWQGAHAILRDLDALTDLYPAPKPQKLEVSESARLEIVEELVEMPAEAGADGSP